MTKNRVSELHRKGEISEGSILTHQGYHTSMNYARNSVVQALMRSFVIIEGEVTLQTSFQVRHRGVIA